MIQVFIVDDHAVVRHGLKLLLEATKELRVIGSAGDGYTALQAPEIDLCDVLILDLSLPRLSGREVMRQMRLRRPGLHIIILSMYPEDQYAVHLIREGASAYLSKDRPPEEVILAVRKVVASGTSRPAPLAKEVPPGRAESAQLPPDRLSQPEQEILLRVTAGRSMSEIATELALPLSAVSSHLHHVKAKLNAPTLADLMNHAHRLGLRNA